MRRWQYQSLAEPVSTTISGPEVITVDKWQSPASVPVRRSRFVSAIFAVSLAFVALVPTVEAITLDKWNQPISQPVTIERRVVNPGHTVVDPLPVPALEVVTLDKWWQNSEVPVRRSTVYRGFPSSTLDPLPIPTPEAITLDKWFQPLGVPVQPRRPVVTCCRERIYRLCSAPNSHGYDPDNMENNGKALFLCCSGY